MKAIYMTTLKDNRQTINRIIFLIVGLLFLGYCLLMILPWQITAYGYNLDESWASAVHIAFRDRIQFGTDFIYTYGPYGFLRVAQYYFPETYGYGFGFSIFIAIAAWMGLFRIARYCLSRRDFSFAFLIPILWFFPHNHLSIDSFQFPLVILPLILYFYISKRITPALVLTVINASLSSLTKHTYLLLAITFVILITIDEAGRLKRIPRVAPLYLAFLWIFWLIAAQDIANIPAYITNSLEIIRGFSASMGDAGHLDEVLLYSFGAGMFLIVLGIVEIRKNRWWGILPILGLAASLFFIFKGAFTRHDGHALQAVFNATPIMLMFVAVRWSSIKNTSQRIGTKIKLSLPLLLGVSALSMVIMSSIVMNHFLKFGYGTYALNLFDFTFNRIPQVIRVIKGEGNFQAIADAGKTAIRAENVLPPISGTVDLYPNEIATLFSYDLEYQPRPTFQSFSAYTGKLARLNAEHLTTPDAAENILFDLAPIDGRMASFEDGLSWPEILTRYDITNLENRYLLLKRNSNPRKYELKPIQGTVNVAINEWLDVADYQDSIWAKIDIHPNLLGKLVTAALRLPDLGIEIETADGFISKYRTVADVMSEGFLLSPTLSSRWDFLDFATTDWQEKLKLKQVQRFRIVAEGFNLMLYPPKYQVNLTQLEFPRQSFERVTGWKEWSTQIIPMPIVGNLQRVDIDNRDEVGWLAHAPMKTTIRLRGTEQSFSANFGILNNAVKSALEEDVGDGVEFKIIALQRNGEEKTLFSRDLQPKENEADRGTQQVSIDLSQIDATQLILETIEGENTFYDWSYWSELQLK